MAILFETFRSCENIGIGVIGNSYLSEEAQGNKHVICYACLFVVINPIGDWALIYLQNCSGNLLNERQLLFALYLYCSMSKK